MAIIILQGYLGLCCQILTQIFKKFQLSVPLPEAREQVEAQRGRLLVPCKITDHPPRQSQLAPHLPPGLLGQCGFIPS